MMLPIKAIEPIGPIYGLGAAAGVGKSTMVRRGAVKKLLIGCPAKTALYIAVPTHVLAEEFAEKLRHDLDDESIIVKTYRGLTAPDPESPSNQMCRIATDADNLRRGGADIRHLCGVERDGDPVLCPYRHQCGWQRQQGQADIYVVPHNLLAHPRASFLFPASALIVDESPIGALMSGFDAPSRSVSLYDLKTPRSVPRYQGSKAIDDDATADLADAKSRLTKVFESALVDEPIKVFAITDAGLTRDDALNARDLTYRRKAKITLAPDMTDDTRNDAVSQAKENQRILTEARLWEMIAFALDKGLDVVPGLRVEIEESNAKQFKVARLRWRERIHSDWQVPTLIMDATAQWKMFKPFWPHIDRVETFDAAMPHATVTQVLWSAAKSKLIGASNTQSNNRQKISHYIEARGTEFKSVLVICQKSVEDELRRLGMPDNVEIGHYNGMRGIDKYKDVECVIIIGRTQPSPDQVELRAEVLFDRVPERGPDWNGTYYPRREVGLCRVGHVGGTQVEMEYHPDPGAEIVRWSACEAELIQSIARGRGINRTADDPLQIDIIGTVPLPVQVDEVLAWEDAQANPFKLMMARGIVLACNTSTKGFWNIVAAVLPDLFKDKQAAQDWGRALTMESANKIYPISESHREGMASTKIRLKGTRYAVPVLIDASLGDPRETAERLLGPLDGFEVLPAKQNTIVHIDPPFDEPKSIPPPVNPEPPRLVEAISTSAPEPELSGEETYRQIVASMDPLDWLDPEAAGLEAAGRWFEAMRSRPSTQEQGI